MKISSFIVIILFLSCNYFVCKRSKIENNIEILLKDYPRITDSSFFINSIIKNADFSVDSDYMRYPPVISDFKKSKLAGSNHYYFIIELDWQDGPMVSFPWKTQLIFSEKGIFQNQLFATHYSLIKKEVNENPFLLAMFTNSRSNGQHMLYGIFKDSFYCYFNEPVQTIDGFADNTIYEPEELSVSFEDKNKDSIKDLVIKGKKRVIIHDDVYSKLLDTGFVFFYNNRINKYSTN
jgi:hypothetical protein